MGWAPSSITCRRRATPGARVMHKGTARAKRKAAGSRRPSHSRARPFFAPANPPAAVACAADGPCPTFSDVTEAAGLLYAQYIPTSNLEAECIFRSDLGSGPGPQLELPAAVDHRRRRATATLATRRSRLGSPTRARRWARALVTTTATGASIGLSGRS